VPAAVTVTTLPLAVAPSPETVAEEPLRVMRVSESAQEVSVSLSERSAERGAVLGVESLPAVSVLPEFPWDCAVPREEGEEEAAPVVEHPVRQKMSRAAESAALMPFNFIVISPL